VGELAAVGGVPAAVEFEDVEGLVDGGGAVEDFFVAFAVEDGLEVAVLDEVIEEGAGADVLMGLGDGEAVDGGEWEGGGHGLASEVCGEEGLEGEELELDAGGGGAAVGGGAVAAHELGVANEEGVEVVLGAVIFEGEGAAAWSG
jgi:hypothetical protein